MLITLIEFVFEDYSYYLKTYPHLKSYVDIYSEEHFTDGEQIPSLYYKEIDDMVS